MPFLTYQPLGRASFTDALCKMMPSLMVWPQKLHVITLSNVQILQRPDYDLIAEIVIQKVLKRIGTTRCEDMSLMHDFCVISS